MDVWYFDPKMPGHFSESMVSIAMSLEAAPGNVSLETQAAALRVQ